MQCSEAQSDKKHCASIAAPAHYIMSAGKVIRAPVRPVLASNDRDSFTFESSECHISTINRPFFLISGQLFCLNSSLSQRQL